VLEARGRHDRPRAAQSISVVSATNTAFVLRQPVRGRRWWPPCSAPAMIGESRSGCWCEFHTNSPFGTAQDVAR